MPANVIWLYRAKLMPVSSRECFLMKEKAFFTVAFESFFSRKSFEVVWKRKSCIPMFQCGATGIVKWTVNQPLTKIKLINLNCSTRVEKGPKYKHISSSTFLVTCEKKDAFPYMFSVEVIICTFRGLILSEL